jgi:hypothetical protein
MNPVQQQNDVVEEDFVFLPEDLAALVFGMLQVESELEVFCQVKIVVDDLEDEYGVRITESFVQQASAFLTDVGVTLALTLGEPDIITAATADVDFNSVLTGETYDVVETRKADIEYWWGTVGTDNAPVGHTVLVMGNSDDVATFVDVLLNGAPDDDQQPDTEDYDDDGEDYLD